MLASALLLSPVAAAKTRLSHQMPRAGVGADTGALEIDDADVVRHEIFAQEAAADAGEARRAVRGQQLQ